MIKKLLSTFGRTPSIVHKTKKHRIYRTVGSAGVNYYVKYRSGFKWRWVNRIHKSGRMESPATFIEIDVAKKWIEENLPMRAFVVDKILQ